MRIFGHRGAPGYPREAENTIGSFKKALQYGAHGVEFDVRRCADGRIVVIHDETIDRTTNGKGCVADLTYEQLRQFDAGFGERIPLLTDVLDTFGGRFLLTTAIHPRKDIVSTSLIEAAREANLQVNVWTVNDPEQASLFRTLGVDAIFSDFPERCLTSAS